jgi:hypothetical protein
MSIFPFVEASQTLTSAHLLIECREYEGVLKLIVLVYDIYCINNINKLALIVVFLLNISNISTFMQKLASGAIRA